MAGDDVGRIADFPLAAEKNQRVARAAAPHRQVFRRLLALADLGQQVGPDRQKATALKAIGHELGRIFQIRDDVLGIWGGKETGKPVGADIKRKKKALPAIHALNMSYGPSALRIRDIYRTQDDLSEKDIHEVLEIMESLKTQQYCQSMAAERWMDCKRMIGSLNLSGQTAKEFTELGEFLLVRKS